MEPYSICDIYVVSAFSILFVFTFVCFKFKAQWSKEKLLHCLVGGWAVLETISLVLSLIHDSNIKLPEALEKSVHLILVTVSLWGLAIIQICTIIYGFDVSMFGTSCFHVKWWMIAAIVECVEVTAIVAFALSQEIPYLELAWIAPLTSQGVAVGVIIQASLLSLPKGKVKDLSGFLLLIGFLMGVFSVVFLVLSLMALLPRVMYGLCTMYLLSLTVIYHPKFKTERELTRRHRRRLLGTRLSGEESYGLAPLDRPLGAGLLPKIYVPGSSSSLSVAE